MARNRQLNNFFMLGIIAILVLFVWLDLKQEKADKQKTVFGLSKLQVQRITIQRQDRDAIQLQKQNNRWRMSQPYTGPADRQRVKSLLNYLRVPASSSFTAGDEDLAQYKLSPADIRLSYNDAEIVFGDSHPLSGERYILFGGQVHLVRDGIYHHLLSSATDFYAAAPLSGRAKLISIQYPGHHLQRQGDGWKGKSGAETLTTEQINTLVKVWHQANAVQVKPLQAKDSQGTVTLGFEDLSRLQLKIRLHNNELILADTKAGVQYHFSADVVPHLLPEIQTTLD